MKRICTLAILISLSGCAGQSVQPTTNVHAAERQLAKPSTALASAVQDTRRSAENRARDRSRHPTETLAFFGVEPGMKVLEIWPGAGWYTEILASLLHTDGQLYVGLQSADGRRAKYRQQFLDRQATDPAGFGKIKVLTFEPPGAIDLGPDDSLDMVLTFRNTHNWINDAGERQGFTAFYKVLRPGGVLGVVQHRAGDDAVASETAKTGYVPEAYVIKVAEEAGFELVDRADINRNPNDTHEHPEGVWTLPPVLRLGDKDRAKYEAIGESDRMTLKFRKPL